MVFPRTSIIFILLVTTIGFLASIIIAQHALNLQDEEADLPHSGEMYTLAVGPGECEEDGQDYMFVNASGKVTHARMVIIDPYDLDGDDATRPTADVEEYVTLRLNGEIVCKLDLSNLASRTNIDLMRVLGKFPSIRTLDVLGAELSGGDNRFRAFGISLWVS
jgi:hypothetical protein